MFLLIKQRWKKIGFTFSARKKVGPSLPAKELCNHRNIYMHRFLKHDNFRSFMCKAVWTNFVLFFLEKRGFIDQRSFLEVHRDLIPTEPCYSIRDKRPSLSWYWVVMVHHGMDWRVESYLVESINSRIKVRDTGSPAFCLHHNYTI